MSWRDLSCSDGAFSPDLCPQQGCVAPCPHHVKRSIQVSLGSRVATAEVTFGLQSISEGGRREREQVNTGSMVYYN